MIRPMFLTLLLICSSAAASFETDIRRLVEARDWRGLRGQLARQETVCHNAVEQENCRLRLQYSRAWSYTKMAADDPGRKTRLLQLAKQDYLAILEQRPRHAQTLDNLILVLEDLQDREALAELAGRDDSRKRAAQIARKIGDISLRLEDGEVAFRSYARAWKETPSDPLLASLLDAFELAPSPDSARRLRSLMDSTDNVGLQNRILASLIAHPEATPTGMWEEALLDWVARHADARTLTAARLRRHFNLASLAPVEELHRRLEDQYLGAPSDRLELDDELVMRYVEPDGWWSERPSRLQALSLAGWNLGHQHLLQGRSAAARDAWLGALYYAPSPEEYYQQLAGSRIAALEILTDLARIMQFHKSRLDPDGAQFARIEYLLFESKGLAYRLNDLPSVHRHHTLMGKMYANLGIFSGGVRGAEFQLTQALETAQKISAQGGAFEPQPTLARLLAEGYDCRLDRQQSCSRDTTRAREWYGKAAMGYLELDAVATAQKSINSIRAISPDLNAAETGLQQIIDIRKTPRLNQLEINEAWGQVETQPLPETFIQQQQFKVYADSAIEGNSQNKSRALSITDQVQIPNSTGNLQRLQQLQQIQVE